MNEYQIQDFQLQERIQTKFSYRFSYFETIVKKSYRKDLK